MRIILVEQFGSNISLLTIEKLRRFSEMNDVVVILYKVFLSVEV